MLDDRATGKVPRTIRLEYEPDLRIFTMGRLLVFFDKDLLGPLDEAERELALAQALEVLRVADIWPDARQVPGSGGYEYRWFQVAARILERHPGLVTYREEGPVSIENLFSGVFRTALGEHGQAFQESFQGRYLQHLSA